MSSTTTITLGYPSSPAANAINPSQRVRLMRSTRKLGAVLGTTPYLLDSQSDLPISLLPIGSKKRTHQKAQQPISSCDHPSSSSLLSIHSTSQMSLHSDASSISSISFRQFSHRGRVDEFPIVPPGITKDSAGRKSETKPRPLYLRLNPVPVSPSDSRFVLPTTPMPGDANVPSSFPPTPLSPTFSPNVNTPDMRRKKMAKLARFLGENVPPELVFPSSQQPSFEPPFQNLNQRGKSVSAADHTAQALNRQRPMGEWVGEWNRTDIRDVQRELRALKA